MSNKTQLQTNNASLEECIARINAAKEVAAELPEAGGGGSASYEVWNGVIYGAMGLGMGSDHTVYYIDSSLNSTEITVLRAEEHHISILANSFIVDGLLEYESYTMYTPTSDNFEIYL